MTFLVGMVLIGIIAFASFCFYCGINSIIEKIKKDGLRSSLEFAFIIYVVTAIFILATIRVGRVLLPPISLEQSRQIQV